MQELVYTNLRVYSSRRNAARFLSDPSRELMSTFYGSEDLLGRTNLFEWRVCVSVRVPLFARITHGMAYEYE